MRSRRAGKRSEVYGETEKKLMLEAGRGHGRNGEGLKSRRKGGVYRIKRKWGRGEESLKGSV